MGTTIRCRAKHATAAGCEDPRCPQKLAYGNALDIAVATGDSTSLFTQAPALPESMEQAEFYGIPEDSAAEREWAANLGARRARMAAERAKRAAEGWTPPILPPVLGARIREYDRKHRDQMLADIHANAKVRVDPKTGRKSASVFRSGVLEAPVQRGVEAPSYAAVDELAPAGRVGRSQGLFASVALDTGTRWLLANSQSSKIADYALRELTVDPDTTYIYSVRNWEQTSSHYPDRREPTQAERAGFEKAASKFWNEGMTLTRWYAYMAENPEVDPRDWEILLSPSDVQAVKSVSLTRLIKNCFRPHEQRELEQLQKQERRAQRWARAS